MRKAKAYRGSKRSPLSTIVEWMRRRKSDHDTDAEDGGAVTRRDGSDAPKVINSTEIVEFKLTVSLFASTVLPDLKNRKYYLEAVNDGKATVCTYKWHSRGGTDVFNKSFETDSLFMTELQKITSKFNLAQYNGYYHFVSGLPDMYGEKIDIRYASGEYIYASDNQCRFLPEEAISELIELFEKASTLYHTFL